MVDKEGELDCEIAHRVAAAWMNWKRMTGVLCDKRMNLKMKGKVYKTVVRPAMMYGAETWAMKKIHEKRLEVAEMRMLRWSCGVTRMDRIRNEVIRNKLRVTEVTKKIQERRMQWYGHVMRRDEDYVGKRVRRMEVAGRRARGRPKKKWEHCVTKDLEEKGLSENDVQNRGRWKLLSRNADPT
uniref:Endonuclease-reverse transcriptase n=1 Tax=Cacopsylla melanoneura TaxID=428564 RepID=A0A8D9A964_9HEMI